MIGKSGSVTNQRVYDSSEEVSYYSSLMNVAMWGKGFRFAGSFEEIPNIT